MAAVKSIAIRFYLQWLVPISVFIGVVLRTRQWLYRKSLWLDELVLSASIISSGLGRLTHPLARGQVAPIGWLWAERASVNAFGTSELSLRLVPWIASLVALGVFPLVARRLVGNFAAPAATLVFATSPTLIYYAAETKQYSSDVTCSLLVVLATTQLYRREPTHRSYILWGVACGTLVWFSQPAILVVVACGMAIIARSWRAKKQQLLGLAAGGAIIAFSLAMDWLVALKHQAQREGLAGYWRARGGYPPLQSSVQADLRWMASASTKAIHFLHMTTPRLALVLIICGAAVLIARRPWSALVLGLPVVLALGAALTDHYPLALRLTLYLYPFLVLLLVAPLSYADRGRQSVSARSTPILVVFALGLVVTTAPGIAAGLGKLVRPDEAESGRQAVAFVARHQRAGDLVLAELGAHATLGYYGSREHVTMDGSFRFRVARPRRCKFPSDELGRATRVWLVFSHHWSSYPAKSTAIYLSQLSSRASLVRSYQGAGQAGAYLFDLTKPPPHPSAPLAPWFKNGCFTIRRR
jgi:Dolichyl-phosphate-mannose-protein mannosyltransferase